MSDPVEMMVLQQAQMLPQERRGEFQMAYMSQRKDRTTALLLSLFLGGFGIDRFYLGQTGAGVGKLLTAGGCGIWMFIDWFLIMAATDTVNRATVLKLQTIYPVAPPGYGPPSGYGPPQMGQGYGPPPG